MTTHDVRRDPTVPRSRPTQNSVADDMRCPEPGCGTDASGAGAPRGWVLVRVVGSGDPARRYCSGPCATRGMIHVELGHHRTVDQPAAVTPIRPDLPPGRIRASSPGRGSADQRWRDLLTTLGKSPADVRAWCVETGRGCPARGPIPTDVRDAYAAAHTEEATA